MLDPTPSIPSCAVIIPALNEAGNIHQLVEEVRRTVAAQVILVDNGSTDATAAEARTGDALVMNRLSGLRIADLGPYRATRTDLLLRLDMQEMTYGWPAEILVKAARRGACIVEVPVSYHSRRAGKSKVSGRVRGTVLAVRYILGVTLRYAHQ